MLYKYTVLYESRQEIMMVVFGGRVCNVSISVRPGIFVLVSVVS